MYKVYVKTDETGRIISVNSDAFLTSTADWTQIDEGEGDRYHHAQGNYFPQPIMTEAGVYRYKLVDDQVVERTAEEIQADVDAIPPPPPDPVRVVFQTLARTDVLTEEQALASEHLFDEWQTRIGTTATQGEYLRYEDGLYRVQQEHTIQEHQPPSVHTAALYTRIQEPGSGPEPWVSGQSYAKGTEVIHHGGVWLSGVDNNIWEPGAAGVFDNIWKRVRDA